ncbi:MAG: NADH-quinone oxidoreductase subunit D [Myxococcales bacterium]|nr:NADH-quinone oxidoreductase subunit D [Myxococcales bacterium]
MSELLIETEDGDLDSAPMNLQMGPSHPAMHGTIKMRLKLDGEIVQRSDIEVGYLHRGFEKSCESVTWTQVLPYTDRLNYVSPLCNNVGYCMAVEKLIGVTATERCQYIRTIMAETSRIGDHLTCVGASAMELGAFTAFLYAIEAREELWRLTEAVTGARLTHSYCRIGGLKDDLPLDFEASYRVVEKKVRSLIYDIRALLDTNRIFLDRMKDIGCISAERALSLGFTGPCLRSTGHDYDVRKYAPYMIYDRLDFEVPVGVKGDNYDRYLVRLEEVDQSLRMIDQCFKQIPAGPINVDDGRLVLPAKDEVYHSIEGTIAHFKLIMDGIKVPPGEVYSYTEAGNGELGFYLISTGEGRPYKCRVRPPCWALMQGVAEMVEGYQIADIVPTFGSINMIGGECDR